MPLAILALELLSLVNPGSTSSTGVIVKIVFCWLLLLGTTFFPMFFYLYNNFGIWIWSTIGISLSFSLLFTSLFWTIRLFRCAVYISLLNIFSNFGILMACTIATWIYVSSPIQRIIIYLNYINDGLPSSEQQKAEFQFFIQCLVFFSAMIHYVMLGPLLLIFLRSLSFVLLYFKKYDVILNDSIKQQSKIATNFYDICVLVGSHSSSFFIGILFTSSAYIFCIEQLLFITIAGGKADILPKPSTFLSCMIFLGIVALCLILSPLGRAVTSFRGKVIRNAFPERFGSDEMRIKMKQIRKRRQKDLVSDIKLRKDLDKKNKKENKRKAKLKREEKKAQKKKLAEEAKRKLENNAGISTEGFTSSTVDPNAERIVSVGAVIDNLDSNAENLQPINTTQGLVTRIKKSENEIPEHDVIDISEPPSSTYAVIDTTVVTVEQVNQTKQTCDNKGYDRVSINVSVESVDIGLHDDERFL